MTIGATCVRVTGYKLRSTLHLLELQRDSLLLRFADSLHYFQDELKSSPEDLMLQFNETERRIAELQTVQSRYNLQVQVETASGFMSLCMAIKLMGGAARGENAWKVASGTRKERRAYSSGPELVRSTDQISAKAALSPQELLTFTTAACKYASAIRTAVAQGNATVVEMDIDPKLLEVE